MVVARIQEQIEAYKKYLQTTRRHPRLHWWESLQHFQAHWDPDAADVAGMFDKCLYNSESRRLWQTEQWRPKEMMLQFFRLDPMTTRLMFNELYNETRDVEVRISRFLFGCDTLLSDFKQTHIATVENNHYHDDYRMIALYLAFRYPEQYAAPYDFNVFRETLVRLGARDIPQTNDIGRFFKVQRTLMTFLEKDAGVLPALRAHLQARKHYDGRCLLPAVDFTYFVSGISENR